MKLTEETPFFFIYSVWTKNGEYREQVKRLVTDYDNYISLKLAGDDAYLSEKMVGYPAELDEVYAESFEEQKKEWVQLCWVMEYRSAGIHGSIKSGILQIFP